MVLDQLGLKENNKIGKIKFPKQHLNFEQLKIFYFFLKISLNILKTTFQTQYYIIFT